MVNKAILITILFFTFATGAIAQPSKTSTPVETVKPAYKFLDNITIDAGVQEPVNIKPVAVPAVKKELMAAAKSADGNVEAAGALQFKYSLLLNIEVELVKNVALFRIIDEWYGVKYLFGGATKNGIGCSALMQVFFTALYGISLPRTAKMQYDFSRRVSRTELKEGDLLFFNTRGGVSHVGMYLTNNKFVHASARGVAISDMFDPYYAARLIGAGRIVEDQLTVSASASLKP